MSNQNSRIEIVQPFAKFFILGLVHTIRDALRRQSPSRKLANDKGMLFHWKMNHPSVQHIAIRPITSSESCGMQWVARLAFLQYGLKRGFSQLWLAARSRLSFCVGKTYW